MKAAVILALVLHVSLAAQSSAPSAKPGDTPPDPKDLCRVEGTVLNALTAEKLRKVTVTLKSPKANYEAATDANGLFLFENVEPGTYRMEFDRQGFVHEYYGAKRSGQFGNPLTLIRAQKISAIEMKMTPNGAVTGKLTDEDGDPVASAYVQLMRSTYINGKMQLAVTAGGNSDEEGVFKLSSVQPGKYFLRAAPVQRSYDVSAKPAGTKTETAYVATYFPGTMDLSAAAPFQVTPGQTTAGMNIQLRKSAVFRIKGKIVGEAGQQNLMVQAYRSESVSARGNMSRSGIRKPDGTFEITGLLPGQYTLVLSTYGGTMRPVGRQTVNIGNEDLENISIAPVSAITAKGSVRIVGDDPPRPSGVRILLVTTEEPFASANVTTKEDGMFSLPDLAPGKYVVSVSGTPAGTYLKALASGDRDLMSAELDLTQTSGDVPLEVTLSNSAAQIDGTVQNEKQQPAVNSFVLLSPDPIVLEQTRRRTNGATTDKDGKFTIKNIAPGAYKIFAFEDFDSPADLDPEYLKKIETKAPKIQIEDKAKAQIDLKQITAADSEQARHQ